MAGLKEINSTFASHIFPNQVDLLLRKRETEKRANRDKDLARRFFISKIERQIRKTQFDAANLCAPFIVLECGALER